MAGKVESVVVVGGGIIGLSTALQLAERGVRVTVIEANSKPAQMSSYCNGAIICPSMAASWASASLIAQNPGEVKKIRISLPALMDLNFYRWCWWFWYNSLVPGRAERNHESQRRLAYFSLSCMNAQIAKYGDKVEMNKTAAETIKIFHSKKDMNNFLQSNQAKFWAERNFEFRELSKSECLELEPSLADTQNLKGRGHEDNNGLVGGVLCPSDSSGDIAVYCSNLEKLCIEKGVKFMYSSRVTSFKIQNRIVESAQLENGENIRGDVYLVALGAESARLAASLGVNLPVYPLKGHIATIESSAGFGSCTRNLYSPKLGLISPLNPNKLRISGIVEAVGFDYKVEPGKGQFLIHQAEGLFKPTFMNKSKVSFHSCLRPVSGDDVAIIGPSHISNLHVNTGHGSKGWTFSWGSAEHCAQMICGEKTVLEQARYSPSRFHPFRQILARLRSII